LRVERKVEEQARRQDDIAAAIHRLELRVSQRVEVNYYEDTSARSVRVGELAAVQEQKREEFDNPTS
jgi:hypothetical protein